MRKQNLGFKDRAYRENEFKGIQAPSSFLLQKGHRTDSEWIGFRHDLSWNMPSDHPFHVFLVATLFESKNKDQETGTRDQGPGTRDQGPGNREQGPGNREQDR